jgi:hypothetical protein
MTLATYHNPPAKLFSVAVDSGAVPYLPKLTELI